jgi:hypothetical protein
VQPRKQELAEWGEAALHQLRGPVLTGVRKKLAAWRDPRARMLRRRRRVKKATAAGAATTGIFGGGSVLSFTLPVEPGMTETLFDASGAGLAGLALVAGLGTISGVLKYRRLMRTPLPEPAPEPVELPPHGSQAREPMLQLRDAEQSLHGALSQLTTAGAGAGGDSVADARATASSAAAALRQVAERLCAVEAAMQHSPEADREALRADVQRLRTELDEGVEGYGRLLAAAGRAVAASGAPEQKDLMQDATDRLAGLAAGMRELSGSGSSGLALEPESRGIGEAHQSAAEPRDPGAGQRGPERGHLA